ncbi:MAG: LysR family transcriptional regulator, partial [Cohaesibacteraceae bacterium]|nr:LysR family transcriptional regulator [Cohaesibacteraceae bacterium]
LDLDQLRTFIAIATHGSFTRAADAVNKTQSAVSMQMRRLEDRIGKSIFIRDGRNSRLSQDGERLLEYAQRLLALNAETFAAFSEDHTPHKVCLGLPDDYALRLLPCILASFASTHPLVEIEVTCEPSSHISKLVESGELDLGIVTRDDIPDLGGRIIRREPLLWVTSSQHRIHTSDIIPLALGTPNCSWRREGTNLLDNLGRPYRIAYSSSSAAAASGAVLAGMAVSILPESAVVPEMRVLRERDGFPNLPHCDISLIRQKHTHEPLHDTLAAHIICALDNMHIAEPESGRLIAAE